MFRPSGHIDWVFDRLQPNEWALLGCHGTEERCATAARILARRNQLAVAEFVTVNDPQSRYSSETAESLQRSLRELSLLPNVSFSEVDLLGSLDGLMQRIDGLVEAGRIDVVLDISSYPKRFFFPIIKRLIRNRRVRNIVVTYTAPRSYPEADTAPLSEQNAALDYLPGFQPMESSYDAKRLIAGVGYVVLGLSQIVLQARSLKMAVDLLFPFPPGPPSYQRNWRFVLDVFDLDGTDQANIFRLDGLDVSEAYNRLLSLTHNGHTKAWLAPFGTKPVSLAMALFGVYHNAPVYYTQPTAYRPDYSSGVATFVTSKGQEGEACFAYPVRMNSRDIYGQLP